MKNNNKAFILEKISIIIFMSLTGLFFSISGCRNNEEETMQNLQSGKLGIYIDEYHKEIGKYKIGMIQIPTIGKDPELPFFAICEKETEFCYPIDAIRVIEKNINLTHSGGFLQNEEDIFAIFTQETMNFYSVNDLKELPEEQQKILLELKEKPRFIYE